MASFWVTSLSFWKSTQNRVEPSFCSSTKVEDHGAVGESSDAAVQHLLDVAVFLLTLDQVLPRGRLAYRLGVSAY